MLKISEYIKESESEKVIVITVPKTVDWKDYMREISKVEDWKEQMNYKLPTLPVGVKNKTIDRCYVVHDGKVRGWMKITGCQNISKGFICTTTEKNWGPGNYLFRSGPFHPVDKDILMKGFMGYKIMNLSDLE